MSTAGLLTVKRIVSDQLTHLDEVSETPSLLELSIEVLDLTRDTDAGPESLGQLIKLAKSLLETSLISTHTAVLPEDGAKLLVDVVQGQIALDTHQLLLTLVYLLLRRLKLRCIDIDMTLLDLVC